MARLLVAGLLVAAASPLLAQTATAPMAPMAQAMTRADVQTRVQTQFAKRDANRDGYLTAEEMTRRGGKQGGGMKMRRMGGDQAMRDPNVAFDRLDANRDGSISRDEFGRAREGRMAKRAEMKQNGQMGGMHGMRHGGRGGGMMGAAMLKMADANRDGKVSLAEANAGALRHFDMMDSNRDGRLTPEERAAGRAHMRQMRQAG